MENLLLKKLQVKPNFKVKIVNAPTNLEEVIGKLSDDVSLVAHDDALTDALFIFAVTKADMNAALTAFGKLIGPQTVCWIFYPKAKTSLASDLNLMQSWGDLQKFELTPCGSAAIDKIWTALRVKPLSELKRSGLGNAEIQKNDFGAFIDVVNKVVTLPPAVYDALIAEPRALATYEKLAYSHKKEYVLWILSAKQEKTKTDRLQKMVKMLTEGKKNPSDK